MKQSEKIENCIEVKGYPIGYGNNFPYAFSIETANIHWGPMAESDKAHAYNIFWTIDGVKICKLLISLERESTDVSASYVAHLENLLRSMALCQIGKFSRHFSLPFASTLICTC